MHKTSGVDGRLPSITASGTPPEKKSWLTDLTGIPAEVAKRLFLPSQPGAEQPPDAFDPDHVVHEQRVPTSGTTPGLRVTDPFAIREQGAHVRRYSKLEHLEGLVTTESLAAAQAVGELRLETM